MAAPASGKRCAGQLRYVHFADWVVPVSFYFVERLSANKWVIARPPCHPDEEDAPEEHQVSVESVEEMIVYEQMDFSTVKRGPQEGVMGPDPILFAHLTANTESPYTKSNLLAACPADLRKGATYISLSPSGPTAFASGGHPPPPGGAPLSVSDGGDSTKADGRLDRLITLMELNLQQQQATAGALPATHSQRPARDSGTFGRPRHTRDCRRRSRGGAVGEPPPGSARYGEASARRRRLPGPRRGAGAEH